MEHSFTLVLVALGAVLGIWGFCFLRRKIGAVLYSARVLGKVLEQQADRLEETPKSVSGMTKVFLPQIQRDFPEFNWEELRAEVEQSVKELLETKNVRSAFIKR